MEALVAEVAGTSDYRNVARHVVDTRLEPSFTGGRAKAWCLLIHAEASLTLSLSSPLLNPRFVSEMASPDGECQHLPRPCWVMEDDCRRIARFVQGAKVGPLQALGARRVIHMHLNPRVLIMWHPLTWRAACAWPCAKGYYLAELVQKMGYVNALQWLARPRIIRLFAHSVPVHVLLPVSSDCSLIVCL